MSAPTNKISSQVPSHPNSASKSDSLSAACSFLRHPHHDPLHDPALRPQALLPHCAPALVGGAHHHQYLGRPWSSGQSRTPVEDGVLLLGRQRLRHHLALLQLLQVSRNSLLSSKSTIFSSVLVIGKVGAENFLNDGEQLKGKIIWENLISEKKKAK